MNSSREVALGHVWCRRCKRRSTIAVTVAQPAHTGVPLRLAAVRETDDGHRVRCVGRALNVDARCCPYRPVRKVIQ